MISSVRGSVLALVAVGFSWALGAPAQAGCVGLSGTADGFDKDVVERAVSMIDRAEYKRRQAPPGVKLRPKAFGRDRRTPITNKWRG